MPPKAGKDPKAKAAAALAARQAAAENAFSDADTSGDGAVDEKELKGLLAKLLKADKVAFDEAVLGAFVEKEFAAADTNKDGEVDYDEFIAYYNGFVDRLAGGAMAKSLMEAKAAAARKAEEQAIAEDDVVYANLHALLGILGAPSVQAYTGLRVPFKKVQDADGTPNPAFGSSSRGLVLDLSRRAQRLLTPWGSLPIGYRLAFPGYQDKAPPPSEEGSPNTKAKASSVRRGGTPWPVVPTGEVGTDGEPGAHPVFFALAKKPLDKPDTVLVLRKLPLKAHFQVVELLGAKCPKGEVAQVPWGTQPPPGHAARLGKLGERWKAQLAKNAKDPRPALPAEDGLDGQPMINHLLAECVAVRADRLEALKKRKEVTGRAANKRFPEDDLARALRLRQNDVDGAAKMLIDMQRGENNCMDKRAGHSTRAHCRYALATVGFDEEAAMYMLTHMHTELGPKIERILEVAGTASGLGYPTRQEVERLLVAKHGDPGPVMAELKRAWKLDIAMMTDLVAASELEEMLTPEQCDAFALQRPMSAEDLRMVEDLYLSDEFGRDKERVEAFLSAQGAVMKRSIAIGQPGRWEVAALLRQMDHQAEPVLAFLQALQNMVDAVAKNGHPTRDDCARQLQACGRDEARAAELMKTVWKIANPKPPKPKGKDKKVAPEHPAALVGFPSKAEAEWALLGTRKADGLQPLDYAKAMALLTRLMELHAEVKEGRYPSVSRDDIVWALDPARGADLIKLRPITPDDLGQNAATLMLGAISEANLMLKEAGVETSRAEVCDALTKLDFQSAKAQKWLYGVGTLMKRQSELGIVSRAEVEDAMALHELDDAKVIELMTETWALQRERGDLGNPSREEIKAMVTVAWEAPARMDTVRSCLRTYMAVDEAMALTLFGHSADAEEREYTRRTIVHFGGDSAKSMGYLKTVSELCNKGEALGNPSREDVIEALEAHGGDARKANTYLREEHHRRRDALLKAEYQKKRESKAAVAK